MDASQLNWLSASDAARAIRDGAISSEQLVEACLARVREVDDKVQAWAFLDPEHALNQARARDQERREGRPTGPLHGVPVAIKDIIDTEDMPTEDGSVLHAGRTPAHDAKVVAMLRAAGAVIFGKTVTTELATYAPGKTRNPHNPEHTPGGSSSGSAAAVAIGMVPLALGSQTNGSVIRPASFCGVYGFKPTHGLIPRTGVLKLSRTLDQLGGFARSIEDLALLGEQLVGWDEDDPDTRPRARPPLVETACAEPPLPPQLAFVKGPAWERASEETKHAFAELVAALSDSVFEVDIAGSSRAGARVPPDHHGSGDGGEPGPRMGEGARPRFPLPARAARARPRGDRAGLPARVRAHPAAQCRVRQRLRALRSDRHAGGGGHRAARARIDRRSGLLLALDPVRHAGAQSAADAGRNGLPLGIQLVGPRGSDARLLRTARWLAARVAAG